MQRVLVVGMTENPGGMESVIMGYYRAVNRNRLQFDFLANVPEIAYESEIRQLGGEVYHIPARHKSVAAFYRALNRFFKDNASKYQSIWVNQCSLANISYLSLAKKYQIKKRIIHCHNSQNGEGFIRGVLHDVNRKRIRRVANIYWSCSNEASAWFFGGDYKELPNYRYIPNAIDTERFSYNVKSRTRIRRALGMSDHTLLIGNVGRFEPQKNQIHLLNIFSEIHKRCADSCLILIGQGSLEESLHRRVAELGLDRQVIFTGSIYRVEDYYAAMDMFVFPSLFEGLPVAPLEAQCSGLPVVMSKSCTDAVNINVKKNLIIDIQDSDEHIANKIYDWYQCVPKDRKSSVESSQFSMAKQIQSFEKMMEEPLE